jgi:iron complex outermembrane receptor protein
MDLGGRHWLELAVRHVGALPEPALGARTQLSARYAWQASDALELSLRGINQLDARHREYPAGGGALIRRAVMAEVRWRR